MSTQDTPHPAPEVPPDPLPPTDDVAALRGQLNQALDLLIAQQDELALLKSAQRGSAATVVQQGATAEKFDAELAALKAEFADYPLIEMFERRALIGADANTDIRLLGEPGLYEDPLGETRYWHLRWFNFMKEGRAQVAISEGYLKVKWDELQDQEIVAASVRIDEFVRTGDRGLVTLYKMPRKLYEYKKRRDAARLAGKLGSEKAIRDLVANAVATRVGREEGGTRADQAGSWVAQNVTMTLTPGATERFTP
jgi:hypothetical protein